MKKFKFKILVENEDLTSYFVDTNKEKDVEEIAMLCDNNERVSGFKVYERTGNDAEYLLITEATKSKKIPMGFVKNS